MSGHLTPFEYYETPAAFTRWLFQHMAHRGIPIVGSLFEPCVGAGAIPQASGAALRPGTNWSTNDLDRTWPADTHLDASLPEGWQRFFPVTMPGRSLDWTVSNTPFSMWLEIAEQALRYSRVGVALHLRASVHEVLKTGPRRTWMAQHPPTGILWLPRFAYQRSPTTGKWTTDSVCACWCIWLTCGTDAGKPVPQFIDYAPEWVIDELDAETPTYRERVDLMNSTLLFERQKQAEFGAIPAPASGCK